MYDTMSYMTLLIRLLRDETLAGAAPAATLLLLPPRRRFGGVGTEYCCPPRRAVADNAVFRSLRPEICSLSAELS